MHFFYYKIGMAWSTEKSKFRV